MADKKRTKTRYVEINPSSSNFVLKILGSTGSHDFSDVKLLRSLLSNEKARLLFLIKNSKPRSIYHLAKLVGRDFKSVRNDLKFLERFGFIEFYSEKKGGRESLRPVLSIDRLEIVVTI